MNNFWEWDHSRPATRCWDRESSWSLLWIEFLILYFFFRNEFIQRRWVNYLRNVLNLKYILDQIAKLRELFEILDDDHSGEMNSEGKLPLTISPFCLLLLQNSQTPWDILGSRWKTMRLTKCSKILTKMEVDKLSSTSSQYSWKKWWNSSLKCQSPIFLTLKSGP